MPKKANNPQNLKPAKKGEPSRNPNGRPKLTEIEKAARSASRLEIAELWPTIKNLKYSELEAIKNDPTQPAIKMAMASALINGIKTGNLYEIHKYYDRLLGTPKQIIDVESDSNIKLSMEESIKSALKKLSS